MLEHQLSRRRLIQTAGIIVSGAALTSFGVGCSGSSAEQHVSPELRPIAPGTITLVDWAESSNNFGQTQTRYPAWNEFLLQYFEESRLNAAIQMAGVQGLELQNSKKIPLVEIVSPHVFEQLYAVDPQVALGIGLQYRLLNHGIKMRATMQNALSEFGYTVDPLIIPAQDMVSQFTISNTDAEMKLDIKKIEKNVEEHPSKMYSMSIQPQLRVSVLHNTYLPDPSKQTDNLSFTYVSKNGGRKMYTGAVGSPDCFQEMTIAETPEPGMLHYSYTEKTGNRVTLHSEAEYTEFLQTCERGVQQEVVLDHPSVEVTGGYHYSCADETYGQTQNLAASFPKTMFIMAGGNFPGETLVHARSRRPSLPNTKYIGSGSFAGDGSFKPLNDIMGLDSYVPQNNFTGDYAVSDGSSAATAKYASIVGLCLQKGLSHEAVDEWIQEYGSEKVWHVYTDVLTRAPYVSTTLNILTEERVREYENPLQPALSRRTFLMRQ